MPFAGSACDRTKTPVLDEEIRVRFPPESAREGERYLMTSPSVIGCEEN